MNSRDKARVDPARSESQQLSIPREDSADSLELSLPSPSKGMAHQRQSWTWADESYSESQPQPASVSSKISTLAFPGRQQPMSSNSESSSKGSRHLSTSGQSETDIGAGSSSNATTSNASSPQPFKPHSLSPQKTASKQSRLPHYGHSRTTSAPLHGSRASTETLGSPVASPARRRSSTRFRQTTLGASSADEDDEDEYIGDSDSDEYGHTSRDTAMPLTAQRQQKVSLTSRSYTTLRSMASAWVPGGSRLGSPQDTPKEGRSPVLSSSRAVVPLPNDLDKQLSVPGETRRQRPVRLDRRRLDKAVGLAVEAAQAAEEDERTWKEKQRRRRAKAHARAQREAQERSDANSHAGDGGSILSRIRTISEYSGLSVEGRKGRFNSLPWMRQGKQRGALPTGSATTSADPSASEGSALEDEPQSEEGDDEEDGASEDNFSLSLYLSSLSYLLSALPTKETSHLPAKEREELRERLCQVLKDIGVGDEDAALNAAGGRKPSNEDEVAQLTEAQRDERLRELLEDELRKAEARIRGSAVSGDTPNSKRRAQSAEGEKLADIGNKSSSTFAGSIATATLELSFAVAAAGVGLLGSGLAHFNPTATPARQVQSDEEPDMHAKIVGEVPIDEKALLPRPKSAPPVDFDANESAARRRRQAPKRSRGLQWDLAMALASSTASSLYSTLSDAVEDAAAQDQASSVTEPSKTLQARGEGSIASRLASNVPPGESEMPEDRLVAMSAAFARSLRRSPLPSQVSTVSSQLLSLLHALDERYELRRRAADEALRRTRQGLTYVRRRGWHIAVARGSLALVESLLAGVEAWRDEGELVKNDTAHSGVPQITERR